MRILVIEDDAALNGILAKRLAEEGHSVDCCFDGRLRLLIIAQLLALTRGDAGKYHLEQLEDAILSGELPAGQRIPAIRSLAAAFRVNPATVRRALRLLLKERLISLRYRHFSVTRDVRLIGRCREKKAWALTLQLRESLSALGYGRRELLDELLSAGAAE